MHSTPLGTRQPTREHASESGLCVLPCGRSGPTALGCLLPAVAESLSDFCPLSAVPAPLMKLFRNLWFYISLYNLAPPLPEGEGGRKEYPWKKEWATAVTKIAEATPPLVLPPVRHLSQCRGPHSESRSVPVSGVGGDTVGRGGHGAECPTQPGECEGVD